MQQVFEGIEGLPLATNHQTFCGASNINHQAFFPRLKGQGRL